MCRACNTSKNADTVTWISIANFSLLCEWRAPPWNHRPWRFPHTDGPPPHPPPAPLPQPVTSGTAGDSYRDNRNIGAGRPRDDDGGGGGGAGWRPRLGAAITLFGSEVTLGPEHVLGLVTIGVLGGVEVRPSHSYTQEAATLPIPSRLQPEDALRRAASRRPSIRTWLQPSAPGPATMAPPSRNIPHA